MRAFPYFKRGIEKVLERLPTDIFKKADECSCAYVWVFSGSNKELRLWRSSTSEWRREMKVKKSRSSKEDEDIRWYLPLDTLLNLCGKHRIYLKWDMGFLMKILYAFKTPNVRLLYLVRFTENLQRNVMKYHSTLNKIKKQNTIKIVLNIGVLSEID